MFHDFWISKTLASTWLFVSFPDHLWVLLPDVLMVVASEVAVDVVKHAFITKFNDITADVSKVEILISTIFWY